MAPAALYNLEWPPAWNRQGQQVAADPFAPRARVMVSFVQLMLTMTGGARLGAQSIMQVQEDPFRGRPVHQTQAHSAGWSPTVPMLTFSGGVRCAQCRCPPDAGRV